MKIFIFIDQYQHAFKIENYKFHSVTNVWNKICFHLYFMTEKNKKTNLRHIAKIIWKKKCFKQSNDFHVVTTLLLSQNHDIKIMNVTTANSFIYTMHKFFEKYVFEKKKRFQAMKNWLVYRNKKTNFIQFLIAENNRIMRNYLNDLSKNGTYTEYVGTQNDDVFCKFNAHRKKLISNEFDNE